MSTLVSIIKSVHEKMVKLYIVFLTHRWNRLWVQDSTRKEVRRYPPTWHYMVWRHDRSSSDCGSCISIWHTYHSSWFKHLLLPSANLLPKLPYGWVFSHEPQGWFNW
jgi:hypothetical protein